MSSMDVRDIFGDRAKKTMFFQLEELVRERVCITIS